MPSRATTLITACAISVWAHQAQALGFGRLTASAVLGQPLNLAIPLQLDPGERVEPECVSAEVLVGETRIGRERTQVRLEGGEGGVPWTARVTTTASVDEPVVEVTLEVGCERRFSRRFIAFADPPIATALVTSALVTPAAAASTAPVDTGRVDTAPVAAKRAAGVASAQPPSASKPTRAANHARPQTSNKARVAAAEPTPRAARRGGPQLVLEAAGPRLRLDMEEPIFMPLPPQAERSEPIGAVASDIEQLRTLERNLAQAQRERQAGQDAALAMKTRLAQAEGRSRAVPWLVSLLVLVIAVAGWMALRLRRQAALARNAPPWWSAEAAAAEAAAAEAAKTDAEAASPAVAADAPFDAVREAPLRVGTALAPHSVPDVVLDDTAPVALALAPLGSGLGLDRDLPAARAPVPPPAVAIVPPLDVALHERTTAMPGPSFALNEALPEPTIAREVSVEELLDLEQQADFFIALGQEDAAIDLLMSHLRGSGGLSPLPYTKLLEIYRRQGDRDAYERIRARFNRRFNAYAPDWDAGPLSGRSLEDYEEAVRHLQTLWAEPLDAMAMLEAMLFRKDAAHELFDLPAYKDVLVLYALARDLWQQGGSRYPAVDVLLPLGGGAGDDTGSAVGLSLEGAPRDNDVSQFQLTGHALLHGVDPWPHVPALHDAPEVPVSDDVGGPSHQGGHRGAR